MSKFRYITLFIYQSNISLGITTPYARVISTPDNGDGDNLRNGGDEFDIHTTDGTRGVCCSKPGVKRTGLHRVERIHVGKTATSGRVLRTNRLTNEPNGTESFLRSHQSQHFMEPESLLPCSQDPATGPYPEPAQSRTYHLMLFL
jgi:hypothetical protein